MALTCTCCKIIFQANGLNLDIYITFEKKMVADAKTFVE